MSNVLRALGFAFAARGHWQAHRAETQGGEFLAEGLETLGDAIPVF